MSAIAERISILRLATDKKRCIFTRLPKLTLMGGGVKCDIANQEPALASDSQSKLCRFASDQSEVSVLASNQSETISDLTPPTGLVLKTQGHAGFAPVWTMLVKLTGTSVV